MPKTSAGILLYRLYDDVIEVLLVHPGGPYWANKDLGVWSIPKGEFDKDEEPLAAAKREFYEETGQRADGEFVELTPRQQKSGKIVYAWALKGNIDADSIVSNMISIPWPPKSGKLIEIPEVDKAAWFNLADARQKISPGQLGFLDELTGI